MSDQRVGQRGARMRGAEAPVPPTKAQLESLVESLKAKMEALNGEKVALSMTISEREAQLSDLSNIAARYERTQRVNQGLALTIEKLNQLFLQREAEEEGINFPDGDRAEWFRGIVGLLRVKARLVSSVEDVLIDDAKTGGLDVSMDRVMLMLMLENDVATRGGEKGKVLPESTTPRTTLKRTLGSSIRQALLALHRIANTKSAGAVGSGPHVFHSPSGRFDSSQPFAIDRRRIKAMRLEVAELNGEIRVMKIERRGVEEENVILRNMYIDLREDQEETYARILELTGQPWKLNPPGALPDGGPFLRTVWAIEQIGRDRAVAEAARRDREEAYAAMNDTEKQEFDERKLAENRREDDALAGSMRRVTAAAGEVGPGETGGVKGAGGVETAAGDIGGEGAPRKAGSQGEAESEGETESEGEAESQGEAHQAGSLLLEVQVKVVELLQDLENQHRDCENEKRRILEDVDRNNRDHEEDKNRLREQNRRDHERCEREKRVLRERIASLRTQIDRLNIAARLYEQQTAGLRRGGTGAPHLEEIHREHERLLEENTGLRSLPERLQLRVNLLEGNTSAEDVERYQAMASAVEVMRELISCDEVRAELNQSQVLLERSLSTQQSLGHAMQGLMNFVLSVRTPGADAALGPPAEALQAISRMHSDFQESERQWEGAERGGTTNAMLRRKLRKTIARAASLRVEEMEDLTAENNALTAQLAENSNIVDLQRWRTVNKEIEIIEREMLDTGPHPLTPPRDLLRLARLQTERLRMMPCPDLRQFAISLQKEAVPTIYDLPDEYFCRQWNELYDDVRAWCTTYYSFKAHSSLIDYDRLVRDVQLLGFYLRDVLIHRDYVPLFVNNLTTKLPNGRADVATAIVFRILVEEIFEPVRFMIGLRFRDATQRWKVKRQYKLAFEVRDMRNNAYHPRFQDRESFIDRKRKQSQQGYTYPGITERGPAPKKRVKSSLQKFNFIRSFEDDEPVGTTRDNDDDIIMNTSRAKLMRTIFSLSTDPTNPQFQEMRSNVSNLIIDTLNPLGHTYIPGVVGVDEIRGWSLPDMESIIEQAGVEAVPEVRDTSWRANPRLHRALLSDIIKRAYDLAIIMRCQRTNIHPLMHDLPSMMRFDHRHFTIVNYPEPTPPAERAAMDSWFAQSSSKPSIVGCARKPICEVLPALLRRGDPELGNYSWRDRVIISKSKVYVGGEDDRQFFNMDPRYNPLYTVAEYPFATDPSLATAPEGTTIGGCGSGGRTEPEAGGGHGPASALEEED
ncbi:hypothetical protein HOY82DRAFT_596487 [Tuber indicum]|nr:hypothetical protein HOY82DRAFT_596487 [Tuber indicum]